MSTAGSIAPPSAPALGESRARVLDLLRSDGEPKTAQEIATAIGLHPNTARSHLDGLVTAGLASRKRKRPTGPGRPQMTYRATDTPPGPGERNYRLLAEMLTSLIIGVAPEPAESAIETGREWGRYLIERPPPSHRADPAEALQRLSAMLSRVGFAPEPGPAEQAPVIDLRVCPFREIAEDHQGLVCSLHLGMLQGALAELRTPLGAQKLEPFVEPSRCRAHLGPAPQPPPET